MTEPIVCRDGKCAYKRKRFLDECIDCDLAEQIENDLLRNSITGKYE